MEPVQNLSSQDHYRFDSHHLITDQQLNNTLRALRAFYARSDHAMWASVSLISLCVLIVLAVCYSGMCQDKQHESEWNNFPQYISFDTDRVPFRDVVKQKLSFLRQFKKRRRNRNRGWRRTMKKQEDDLETATEYTEMEQLLM